MNDKYLIIPDLHGQYYTFIEMLSNLVTIKNGRIISSDFKIILLGDLIDKGHTDEQILLINFIYDNLTWFIILLGNHEYKTRKKIMDSSFLLGKHYDFYLSLENDIELKNKFISINDEQIRFYEDDFLLCTHSPCLLSHIEKKNGYLTQYSYKRPNEFSTQLEYKNYVTEFFREILEENTFQKLHIFGHLGLKNVLINNTQIWLDTQDIETLVFAIIENSKINFIHSKHSNNIIFISNNIEDTLPFLLKSLLV